VCGEYFQPAVISGTIQNVRKSIFVEGVGLCDARAEIFSLVFEVECIICILKLFCRGDIDLINAVGTASYFLFPARRMILSCVRTM
jgi:hypothetical protein